MDTIDLSAFTPQDTAELEILKPGGTEGTGWIITFAGPGHPKAVAYSNEATRKTLRRQAQLEAQRENGRKIKPEDRDVEQVRRDNVAWIAARIVGWTPIRLGGDEIHYSEEVAIDLLVRPEMGWVLGQMIDFLNDDRSFTKGSARS